MPEFEHYSAYYDLFYAQKDYEGECTFVEGCFRSFSKHPVRTVVDWGCGTGSHSLLLATRGFSVIGVDRSPSMIEQARRKASDGQGKSHFVVDTIREALLPEVADAAISMFAVVGYQVDNESLLGMMANVRRNLRVGGVFLFDCWYGPAVLHHGPREKIGEFANERGRVLRIVRPSINCQTQTVDLGIQVLSIQDGKLCHEVVEQHTLRYFFDQELHLLLAQTGFEVIRICPAFDLQKAPDDSTWNIVVVARAT